jgi:hypothetical protein
VGKRDSEMFTAGHPEEDVLEQYAMGKLNEPIVESIEDHVLVCASCQDRLDFTETYVSSMRSALKSAQQVAAVENPWKARIAGWFQMPAPAWAAAAAVVVLAIGAIFGTQYFSHSGAPVAVALTATRGETTSIAAKGPLDLNLDARDLPPAPSYRVQIVDGDGASVWQQQSATMQDGHVHVLVNKRLSRGQYFVRLFASDASTPREYALQLR